MLMGMEETVLPAEDAEVLPQILINSMPTKWEILGR
jgi:hypothetical protein